MTPEEILKQLNEKGRIRDPEDILDCKMRKILYALVFDDGDKVGIKIHIDKIGHRTYAFVPKVPREVEAEPVVELDIPILEKHES